MYNNIYKKNDDYIYYDFDNSHLLINNEKGNWLKINDTAYNLWQMIDGKASLEEIITIIAKQISFDVDFVKMMYKDIIETLITSCVIIDISNDEKILPLQNFENQERKYPKTVWLHVTDECNLTCPFCYSRAKSNKTEINTLDCDRVIGFLSDIEEKEREQITISGGEPFLYKDIARLTDLLKNKLKFKNITLITNGTINHHLYEKVLKNIDVLQISFDGTTPEIEDLTRGKGSYEKAIEGISVANSCKGNCKVSISATVTKNNFNNIKDYPEFAFNHKVNHINLNKIIHVGRGVKFDVGFTKEEFDKMYVEFLENVKKFNQKINYEREIVEIGVENRRPFITYSSAFDIKDKVKIAGKLVSCGMGVNLISVTSNGNIYPCPSLHLDEYKIGSIDEKIQDAIVNGRSFNLEHNVENEKSSCYKCKSKYFCGGGCRAEALAFGDIDGKYDECDSFKDLLMETIKSYK